MEHFDCAADQSSGVCGKNVHAKYKNKCGLVVSQKDLTLQNSTSLRTLHSQSSPAHTELL